MKIDTLIVGQGLAGSVLALELLARGQRVLVVDRDEEVTSSKVAAGLVTPLAGSRFNVPEGLEERLGKAKRFYWDQEEKTGARFFHHTRIARLFRTEKEAASWEQRLAGEPEKIAPFHAPLSIDSSRFHAPHGGFEMKEGGWLDVPGFLETTRQTLLERASYAIARLNAEDVQPEETGTGDFVIRWKNIEAKAIMFAEGWRGNRNRFFDWLPMKPAAGDILDLEIPELDGEKRIVNRGGWLLPLGNGRFRAGSNYRHTFADETPVREGRDEVLGKLSNLTPCEATVSGHRSAIRPIIHRSQVFMGAHPRYPRVFLFNGLGSKGVLNAPWYAERLVTHLLEGKALPADADIRQNFG